MDIKSVEFIKSVNQVINCPKPFYPEIAFIGRSNVGKSSLINFICNNNKLAKVSSTPGKTKTINHFLVNKKWYLVDLPGYGFAQLSKKERENFLNLIKEYIAHRSTLKCTLVLIDFRLEFQKSDKAFILWLAQQNLPFALVFTKIDKLSSNQIQQQKQYYEKELSALFYELPNLFFTSTKNKIGREELLDFFDYLLNNNNDHQHK